MTIRTVNNASVTIITFEQDMKKAFAKLKATTKKGMVRLAFEIEHDHFTQFSAPAYTASRITSKSEEKVHATNPALAVDRLLRKLGITTVEQYIRMKESQS